MLRFLIIEGNKPGLPIGHNLWVLSKALVPILHLSKYCSKMFHNDISRVDIYYSHFISLTELGF